MPKVQKKTLEALTQKKHTQKLCFEEQSRGVEEKERIGKI